LRWANTAQAIPKPWLCAEALHWLRAVFRAGEIGDILNSLQGQQNNTSSAEAADSKLAQFDSKLSWASSMTLYGLKDLCREGREGRDLQEDLVLDFVLLPQMMKMQNLWMYSGSRQYAIRYAGMSSDVPEVCSVLELPALLGSCKNRWMLKRWAICCTVCRA
jgi:hypothetical protein